MKSYGVTIQMKATEQYFPVVFFIVLYMAVLTFESMDEMLWFYLFQMRPCWQNFRMLLYSKICNIFLIWHSF